MGTKSGVKLACKQLFAPMFLPEESPVLLDRPFSRKKMSSPEQLLYDRKNYKSLQALERQFPRKIERILFPPK